ncbi:hypothetical protein M9H77_08602 [Catharanthus roseus]|uniref:Uncharacterized protein n=1 Tax=Catharanthus roseus TaxID=4058 RepID=A0ACC0BYI0_CATRO|nr:hypothetical protein M9H77_08602 [Catharanthus roseus]
MAFQGNLLGSLSESRHISAASTPKFKETCNATIGLHGQVLDYQTTTLPYHWLKQATDSWDTYQVCPGTNLSFKPLLGLHKVAIPPYSMMRCPRRPIGPRPTQSTPLFKWIHSPESITSTPSEEVLVRGLATYSVIL